MITGQRIILFVGALVVVLMVLFPPYFGIDVESEGQVHGSIGYHPLWRAPASEYVYEALTSQRSASIDETRLSSFQSRLNVVRLVFNLAIVAVVVGVSLIIYKKRTSGV